MATTNAELQSEPSVASTEPTAGELAHGTEALSHLAKMSGTGSTFGATDYVAIHPAAVAALIIAFASALSLLVSLFLFLAVISIACALFAIYKIRNSNGTQSGYGLAIGGILVSLVIGAVVGARETREWMTVRDETNAAAAEIARFGQELHAGNYDNAYDGMLTEDFRSRLDRVTFRRTFEDLQQLPNVGQIESMEWNQEPMLIQTMADGDIRLTSMALLHCKNLQTPGHEYIVVNNKEGTWKIDGLPHLFPEKHKPRRGFGAPTAGPR